MIGVNGPAFETVSGLADSHIDESQRPYILLRMGMLCRLRSASGK